jgi:hypothetical protein
MENCVFLVMCTIRWHGEAVISVHISEEGAKKEAERLFHEDGAMYTVVPYKVQP